MSQQAARRVSNETLIWLYRLIFVAQVTRWASTTSSRVIKPFMGWWVCKILDLEVVTRIKHFWLNTISLCFFAHRHSFFTFLIWTLDLLLNLLLRHVVVPRWPTAKWWRFLWYLLRHKFSGAAGLRLLHIASARSYAAKTKSLGLKRLVSVHVSNIFCLMSVLFLNPLEHLLMILYIWLTVIERYIVVVDGNIKIGLFWIDTDITRGLYLNFLMIDISELRMCPVMRDDIFLHHGWRTHHVLRLWWLYFAPFCLHGSLRLVRLSLDGDWASRGLSR